MEARRETGSQEAGQAGWSLQTLWSQLGGQSGGAAVPALRGNIGDTRATLGTLTVLSISPSHLSL